MKTTITIITTVLVNVGALVGLSAISLAAHATGAHAMTASVTSWSFMQDLHNLMASYHQTFLGAHQYAAIA